MKNYNIINMINSQIYFLKGKLISEKGYQISLKETMGKINIDLARLIINLENEIQTLENIKAALRD